MNLSKISYTAALLALMLYSCDTTQNELGKPSPDNGLFLTTETSSVQSQYIRSTATGITSEFNGSMSATVEETDWAPTSTDMTSRSEVTGDEITWADDNPDLGIYITDADDETSTIAKNLALTPNTHILYNSFFGKDGDTGTELKSSSYFWNTWTNKELMKSSVNFYGYYPRPHNNNKISGALDYNKTSIISADKIEQSSNNWNELAYVFADQNDDNMSWHDVMYSVPETEGIRYGNKSKVDGDNIQLHFMHAFSLLDIEISKGSYKGDCTISSLTLSGTQIYTEGVLDIKSGTITPSKGTSGEVAEIKRVFSPQKITEDEPFHKTMIAQPTQDGEAPNDSKRLVITCNIDGTSYSCAFPTLKLDAGKKYKIKLTLKPAGLVVFKIWDGAQVKIGSTTLSSSDSGKEGKYREAIFTVTPESGHKIIDVLKNGVSIFVEGKSEYSLDSETDSNTTYNIVASNETWYATDGLQLHFDGIRNKHNNGGMQDKDSGKWQDLSGHDNDGTLRSFTSTSGWNGNGLVFDGVDDVVYFRGDMTQSYSMEFYIVVDKDQRGAHPRFVAEGPLYPCFYFYGSSEHYDGKYISSSDTRVIAFYDRRNVALKNGALENTTISTNGSDIIQLDFTYDAPSKTLKWYINGIYQNERIRTESNENEPESVDIATIGNRYQDNSRVLAATYYSFMIYNRALLQDEITANYNVNVSRYGTKKQ